jgi:hypothetical protein
MSNNTRPPAVPVPLEVFGSLVTETKAPDLPIGTSPDNQDVVFVPGDVSGRPALERTFYAAISASQGGSVPTIVYGKSFVAPDGAITNLYFDSNGILWTEDVAFPGTLTKLFQSTPGSYCKSVTSFGREYIAISDGLHGQEMPLQWDGVNLDRVTQDGPASPPVVTSLPLPSVSMAPTGSPTVLPTTGQLECDPENPVYGNDNPPDPVHGSPNPGGNTLLYYTALYLFFPGSLSGLTVGSSITISGSPVAAYNATWIVSAIFPAVGSGNNLVQINGITLPAGLSFAIGGTITIGAGVTMSRANNIVTVTTGGPHGLQPGYQAQITGQPAATISIVSITIDNEQDPGIATVVTSAPHGLVPEVFVSITGVQGVAVGGSTSIVISGTGVSQATTATPHGLSPGANVTIGGVTVYDGDISVSVLAVPGPNSFTYADSTATASTATGATVKINWPVPQTETPTYFEVQTAPTPTSFQIQVFYSDGVWNTGTVSYAWDGTFYVKSIGQTTVQDIGGSVAITGISTITDSLGTQWEISVTGPIPFYPGPASIVGVTPSGYNGNFVITGINYNFGSWAVFVTAVGTPGAYVSGGTVERNQGTVSVNTFTYQQYGPNATSSVIGTVTPYGQASPGIHQCQISFLTRNGYVTAPSPPVQVVANGGQYLSVSNLAIGPPNTIARIIEFTGADGQYFFYIPVPGQVNGQIVSTATQVDDNTSTAVVVDFGDPTLFAATGINVPGNNLPNQIVLDSALGFGLYASRLVTYGQRNRITNFLNMGFDGGSLPSSLTVPTGWVAGDSVSALITTPGRPGQCIQMTLTGNNQATLSQSAYEDYLGVPIIQPNTQYHLRCWVKPSVLSLTLNVTLSSASTMFTSSATISSAMMNLNGGWVEAVFSLETPGVIPSDFLLTVSGSGTGNLLVDELSMIFSQTPYTDQIFNFSYANNPEGFDGVSGPSGPANDTHKVMVKSILRDSFYCLTRDPGGRLHQVSNVDQSEPAGWTWNEVASNCGALSALCLTESQSDDTSGSGGEEWFAWASSSGARIFGGGEPSKISQELQPDWNSINLNAALTLWAINDPVARVIYFGLPVGEALTPSLIYPMDYKELDTSRDIEGGSPIRIGFSGKLLATDHTRKWTRWNLAMNGAALMYRGPNQLQPVFFCGNGQPLGAAPGFGQAYTLNPLKYTDDDYGQIYPYYVTYGFVNHDQEAALQLGSGRKTNQYNAMFISGIGYVNLEFFMDSLSNPVIWNDGQGNQIPIVFTRTLSQNPKFDAEFPGIAQAQRIFFKISSSPLAGQTDNTFSLQKFIAWLRANARSPVRGSAQ